MLDASLVRDRIDFVQRRLELRGGAFEGELQRLVDLDGKRRALIPRVEESRRLRKDMSDRIAQARKKGAEEKVTQALVAESQKLGDRIKTLEQELEALDSERRGVLLRLPNLPHESVPEGKRAEHNVEVRRWGTPRAFDFTPKAHWDLGPALGILDFDRATKISGARFAVLMGAGARLSRALIDFMLDLHTREHGYVEVTPPFLVKAAALEGTGNLPKFEGDLFRIGGDWDLFLIPTAEVPLTNLHRDEILDGRRLPLKYVAYSPCFRSEAGSYGADVRGLIRQHQFEKVELVKFAAPGRSYDELEGLTADAERVLQRLELPYRTVALCTGDMGFAAAKTYDIEVWLPSQQTYREISSCSNTEAFQARRASIKFRPDGTAKAEFAHTLNGSGLAVGRTLIAILENFQERDGSVRIPDALRPYMHGLEIIQPAS